MGPKGEVESKGLGEFGDMVYKGCVPWGLHHIESNQIPCIVSEYHGTKFPTPILRQLDLNSCNFLLATSCFIFHI
jgi:hypothetical protein